MFDKIERLNDLNLKEQEQLCDEIAEFLASKTAYSVDTIMRNISVLEVTMALYQVFDFTQDTIIFDDVEQSLVHQVLQGNAEHLRLRSTSNRSDLKSYNLSGGFAGDGISLAMAQAVNNPHRTIVVLDDNALNHGTTYEALLEIGRLKPNLTLVLLDEQKSLLRHYNSVDAAIKSIRISKVYTDTKRDMKNVLNSSRISRPLLESLTQFRDAIKDAVIEPTIFSHFGFDYHGPINGQHLGDLSKIFKLSLTMTGPHIIHVQTRVKEKEFRKLEFPAFKTDQDRPDNYSDYLETLDTVMTLHDDITLINDVKYPKDHFKAFQYEYPERYHTINGSIDLMVTMLAGLSDANSKPVLSVTSKNAPALMNQLQHHVHLMNSLVIIIRDAGLSTYPASLYHGIYDFPLTANLKEFEVLMAKDMNEASYLLEYALNQGKFTILRIPASSARIEQEVLNFEDVWDEVIPFNKDSKGIIITFGPSVKSLERKIKINNLDIGLINARTINKTDLKLMNKIKDSGLQVLTYNCEGRDDLLKTSIYKSMIEDDCIFKIHAMSLEGVNLSLSAKQIKDQYHLNIDDCILFFES